MTEVSEFLESLRINGKLAGIDVVFASFAGRLSGSSPALMLLAALVSNAVSTHNEIALPAESVWTKDALRAYLKKLTAAPERDAETPYRYAPAPEWSDPAVDAFVDALDWPPEPGAFPHLFREIRDDAPEDAAPDMDSAHERKERETGVFDEAASAAVLVLRGGLLYLGRMYQNEIFLRDYLFAHVKTSATPAEPIDFGTVTSLELEDEQKAAVSAAVNSDFLVISGGPGTGKTTIVSVILALRRESPGEIVLCAPTGKAQVRMKEALNRQLGTLRDKARAAEIAGIRSSTIHRMLDWSRTRGAFRRNSRNRLPYKLFIVDECSMIDLSLMVSLLKAVPDDASVILLGDRCQLSSVDPGSVFGDVCAFLRARHPDRLAELTVSRRFKEGGEICTLKNAVNEGRDADAWAFLEQTGHGDVFRVPLPGRDTLEEFLRGQFAGTWLGPDARPYCEAETIGEAWSRFERFRILTPLNRGVFGAENLNRIARVILGFASPEPRFRDPRATAGTQTHIPGEAFLVLKNDNRLNVFNGDVGILWYADENGQPEARGGSAPGIGDDLAARRLLVFFPVFDDGPGWHGLPLEVLPDHAPAYAFTIHKSQGSDYERVLMLLPSAGRTQSILTREIVYNGLTRAKERVVIAAEEDVFRGAVRLCTDRVSGLRRLSEISGS